MYQFIINLLARVYLWYKNYNGIRTSPTTIALYIPDGTEWTTALVDRFHDESVIDIFTVQIFQRIKQDNHGRWMRMEEFKQYESDEWPKVKDDFKLTKSE